MAYCRGVDLTDILRVWRGNASSGWDPYTVNMATPQIIIGAQTLHATGYAMGIQNDGADSVAVTFFGDGATSEGDVNEAMVFAASFQAPVVFFCSEQPLGHLGTGPAAVPHPAGGQGRRLRHPQPPGGRERRPRRHGSHPGGPGPGPARRRTDLHRSRHLPHGAAHHRG